MQLKFEFGGSVKFYNSRRELVILKAGMRDNLLRQSEIRSTLLVRPLVTLSLILVMASTLPGKEYYVSASGNDEASGESTSPWRTLSRAIKGVKASDTLLLEDGIWLLDAPLTLRQEHSDLTIRATEGLPIISGGLRIRDWLPVADRPGAWFANVPNKELVVRQLYSRKQGRLTRSRIPNRGWLRADKLSTVTIDVNREGNRDVVNDWRLSHPHLFAGMRYREEDRKLLADLPTEPKGAMVQTIAAWESSWQSLRSVNHKTGDLRMFTPSRYPLAHWSYSVNKGGGTPFAIENTLAGLDQPYEWFFDEAEHRILLLSPTGVDPNDDEFYAAHLSTLLLIDGADHVKIEGIGFAHAADVLGRYELHPKWVEANKKFDSTFPTTFPEGITDAQTAPHTGAAVHVQNATGVKFQRCTFSDVGGYALHLGRNSQRADVGHSRFMNLGAGGINIDPETRSIKESEYPSYHHIHDNEIHNGGTIHPAAVGIRVAESHHNRIEHNEISHFGYTGLSIGWNWNPRPNQTTDNLIIGNHIHHVMNRLSDGSGIYTLGSIPGTRIERNYIHDVIRSDTAIGAGNSGIFFDQFSKGADVKQNVLRRIHAWHENDKREGHPIKHHRNEPVDHTFEDNDVSENDAPIRLKEVAEQAGPRREKPQFEEPHETRKKD